MLAPFLIMLREGLEAALIVGIIAGYLRRTGRAAWLPAVWIGVFLAIAAALFAGAALQLASASFPQKAQELFEGVIGLVAVAVLVWMVFWMRRAARSMKSTLHASVEAAVGGGAWALFGMVFLAVAREGLESIFFLLAVLQQSRDAMAPLGAALGVAVSAGIGWGIYAGALRLDLARFFRWTGVFILFVAAGLLAGSLKALHEAGVWNGLQARVYDISHILPETSPLGTVLAGVLGYRDAPTLGEAVVYAAFLTVMLVLFLRPDAAAAPRRHSVRDLT